jgi:hypothetical protein
MIKSVKSWEDPYHIPFSYSMEKSVKFKEEDLNDDLKIKGRP